MDLTNLNKDRKKRRNGIDISSMVYGKIPPQAKDIEEVILGALMMDINCVTLCMARVFPEMFYVHAHQLIFSAIQKIYDRNQPIDIGIVIEQLKKDENLEIVGGPYAVVRITNSVVSGANIESHILIISEMYLKRETINTCGNALNEAYEDSTDAFDIIRDTDSALQNIQERVLGGSIKDLAYYGMKVLEQHASVKQTGALGIKTGLTALDKTISGLVAPDLIILAARPGIGKTGFALSITYKTSVINNIPCAWFSLEMDGIQLVRRIASIDTGIPHERIRNGTTSKEEDIQLGSSVDKISGCKIFIEDKTNINVRDIRTRAALLKKKYGIKYIVVDYIQLMTGVDNKNKNREQIVAEISRALKCIAKELEIPVIALSQLSRAVEARPDKMPQLSDLRESGGIEQDADEVIFLMRPEYYHMTEPVQIGETEYHPAGLCIGNIAKNRHGSTKHVAMRFNGPTMFFSDYYIESYSPDPKQGWHQIKDY